jgi:hypothetical protein
MPVPLTALPDGAVALAAAVRQTLESILGDDLVALWLHGGTTFADRPRVTGDLDVCAVVGTVTADEREPDLWSKDATSRPYRIAAEIDALARARDASVDLVFLLASDPATNTFFVRHPNTSWPVLFAHLLRGQYVPVLGPEPHELLQPPTDAELRYALDREIEHLERHVHDGDNNDPYECTYAFFNGCRILHTLATGSPVLSKRSGGDWGLANLPARWHPAIEAAGRNYDGVATDEDKALLRHDMPPFVAFVREHLAPTDDREGPPRWS